jgi:hypothetical protein
MGPSADLISRSSDHRGFLAALIWLIVTLGERHRWASVQISAGRPIATGGAASRDAR